MRERMFPLPEKILPHRAPLLLLDEVIELGENRVVATRVLKRTKSSLAAFPGASPLSRRLPG